MNGAFFIISHRRKKQTNEDIKNGAVLFALIERNDTTGVYVAEQYDLVGDYFKWTPAEHVLPKRKIPLADIREYYVAKPIAEVIKLLKAEFIL